MDESAESALVTRDSGWMYVAITLMGVGCGSLAGLTAVRSDVVVLNLHLSVWLFLVVWSATTAALSYERVPSGALGAGLYLVAALSIIAPVSYFFPQVRAARRADWGERATEFATGFEELFVWAGVGGGVAVLSFGLARLLRRRAARVDWEDRRQRITAFASRARADGGDEPTDGEDGPGRTGPRRPSDGRRRRR